MKIVSYFTIFISTMVISDYSIDMAKSADRGEDSRSTGKRINLGVPSERRRKEPAIPPSYQSLSEKERKHKSINRRMNFKWEDELNDQLFRTVFENCAHLTPNWDLVLEKWQAQMSQKTDRNFTTSQLQSQFYRLFRKILNQKLNRGGYQWNDRDKIILLRTYYQTMKNGDEGHAERFYNKFMSSIPNVRLSCPDLMKLVEELLRLRKRAETEPKWTDASESFHHTVPEEALQYNHYFAFLPESPSTSSSRGPHNYYGDKSSNSYQGSGHNEPDLELRLNPLHLPEISENPPNTSSNQIPSTPNRQQLGHARFRHGE